MPTANIKTSEIPHNDNITGTNAIFISK